ncbi:hypothetical protein CIB95_06530 [Lottiidibacillus patelloidae]|uniref:DUF2642 domain-containing protein n=1 Tax=Lottiidibacillus patelloidae TaxID=2670334 RepID=A0A263BTQ7_9BACI|nr:hypothetical protein [Lottiidibacillus patelloidae]OZM57121.1 hypothetical protein CIB95_06530 [Lottiidibacillus patelloidae]
MSHNLYSHFQEKIGTEILIVTKTQQLNILGQTFRPVFCGKIAKVEESHVTLDPIIIKFINAPFFKFPTPLNIPFDKIAHFTEDFDCDTKFPLT